MSIRLKDTIYDNIDKLSSSAGGTTQPIYFNNGKPTVCSYTLGKSVPSDAKFTDTNTTYSQATSSTLGLVKIGYSTSDKNYAVQLNGSGQMYVNVPWTDTDTNTDTKNTAGSTDSSSKLFLIGATSQAVNPQTYSHNTAYVGTDGCLYSNSTKVSVEGHTHSYASSTHTHSYINAKDNYTFDSTTLPNSFDLGISAGFVNTNSGFGNYGTVLTVRTYSGGGGTLQLYAPYSKTYGGERLKARFGNYDSSNGNSWTTLKELAWTSDIPTSLKCPNSLTIQGNGTSLGSYDGSAAKTINITCSNIGAATSGHTHNYAGSSSAGGAATSIVSRTLWGKTFNGTGNVSGLITIGEDLKSSPAIKFHNGEYIDGYGNIAVYTDTNVWSVYHKDKVNDSIGLYVTGLGDVGVCTRAPQYKLHVKGSTGIGIDCSEYSLLSLVRSTTSIEAGIGITFANSSGNVAHLHALPKDKSFYRNDGTTNHKLLDSGNYTSYCASAGHGHDALAMSNSAYISMTASANSTSLTKNTPFGITYGRIQCYGTLNIVGDSDGSTTEYVNISAGYENSTNSNGLSIGYSTLTWKGSPVITSSNWSSYITVSGSSGSNYLGVQDTRSSNSHGHSGRVSWHLKLNSSVGLNAANSSLYSGVLELSSWADRSAGRIYQMAFCGESDDVLFRAGQDSWGSWHRVWHSGNITFVT